MNKIVTLVLVLITAEVAGIELRGGLNSLSDWLRSSASPSTSDADRPAPQKNLLQVGSEWLKSVGSWMYNKLPSFSSFSSIVPTRLLNRWGLQAQSGVAPREEAHTPPATPNPLQAHPPGQGAPTDQGSTQAHTRVQRPMFVCVISPEDQVMRSWKHSDAVNPWQVVVRLVPVDNVVFGKNTDSLPRHDSLSGIDRDYYVVSKRLTVGRLKTLLERSCKPVEYLGDFQMDIGVSIGGTWKDDRTLEVVRNQMLQILHSTVRSQSSTAPLWVRPSWREEELEPQAPILFVFFRENQFKDSKFDFLFERSAADKELDTVVHVVIERAQRSNLPEKEFRTQIPGDTMCGKIAHFVSSKLAHEMEFFPAIQLLINGDPCSRIATIDSIEKESDENVHLQYVELARLITEEFPIDRSSEVAVRFKLNNTSIREIFGVRKKATAGDLYDLFIENPSWPAGIRFELVINNHRVNNYTNRIESYIGHESELSSGAEPIEVVLATA